MSAEDRIRAALRHRAQSVESTQGWDGIARRLDEGIGGSSNIPAAPSIARRVAIAALAFVVFAVGGLLAWRGFGFDLSPSTGSANPREIPYRDPDGWILRVPPGWHVLSFDVLSRHGRATGAMFSNASLPIPIMTDRTPIQASSEGLPKNAVALVIARSEGPALPAGPRPPLSLDQFTLGSALAGGPTLDTLIFRANGESFVATVKAGPDVSASDWKLVSAMVASFEFTSSSSPSESGNAISISGVPFDVCRPRTMEGDFGVGMQTAWVFEEERVPGAGCIGSEGFQRLGIGTGSRVQFLSSRITDLLSDDAYKVWPYASLDLDGDGVSEIVVAKEGDSAASRTLWFLQIVGGDQIGPVSQSCGAACDPEPFSTTIGSRLNQDGTTIESGMYCEGQGASLAVVEWSARSDLPLTVLETKLMFADGLLDVVSERSYSVQSADQYPPNGFVDVCGIPTQEP